MRVFSSLVARPKHVSIWSIWLFPPNKIQYNNVPVSKRIIPTVFNRSIVVINRIWYSRDTRAVSNKTRSCYIPNTTIIAVRSYNPSITLITGYQVRCINQIFCCILNASMCSNQRIIAFVNITIWSIQPGSIITCCGIVALKLSVVITYNIYTTAVCKCNSTRVCYISVCYNRYITLFEAFGRFSPCPIVLAFDSTISEHVTSIDTTAKNHLSHDVTLMYYNSVKFYKYQVLQPFFVVDLILLKYYINLLRIIISKSRYNRRNPSPIYQKPKSLYVNV